ncbi:RlpA-like double-psi beta-barrel domain-containing protein [Candidatus Halobeggiatoa sp. HSG11]|nr:RlpA-like double-psi beta-barrel domain-containing protein [Candidatus Halobeggiatoa sp. HSG11]
MLNNIFKILLLGLVGSCTVHPNYSSPNENHGSHTAPQPAQPTYSTNPRYLEPRPNRPSKRLAPVSPPVRSKDRRPIHSNPYPSRSRPPSKRIVPPAYLRNNGSRPSKGISRPKYLKQPSSNYKPQVPSIKGYMSKGYASQYKLAEHGMKTSSGQIYDMYGMTAAHTELPLMSTVVVKNLRTGRSVVVTINDRLHHGLIKLSYVAANNLGLFKYPAQLLEIRGL